MRQSENLALTIIYHDAVVTDPDILRPLVEAQPVLGIFGEEDRSIPSQEVLEFGAALNSLKSFWTPRSRLFLRGYLTR